MNRQRIIIFVVCMLVDLGLFGTRSNFTLFGKNLRVSRGKMSVEFLIHISQVCLLNVKANHTSKTLLLPPEVTSFHLIRFRKNRTEYRYTLNFLFDIRDGRY